MIKKIFFLVLFVIAADLGLGMYWGSHFQIYQDECMRKEGWVYKPLLFSDPRFSLTNRNYECLQDQCKYMTSEEMTDCINEKMTDIDNYITKLLIF